MKHPYHRPVSERPLVPDNFSGNSRDRRAALRRWFATNSELVAIAVRAIMRLMVAHFRSTKESWLGGRLGLIEAKATATAERMRLRALAAAMSQTCVSDTDTNRRDAAGNRSERMYNETAAKVYSGL